MGQTEKEDAHVNVCTPWLYGELCFRKKELLVRKRALHDLIINV